eukprot:14634677-Alexandrium_andersonii.AAC.2
MRFHNWQDARAICRSLSFCVRCAYPHPVCVRLRVHAAIRAHAQFYIIAHVNRWGYPSPSSESDVIFAPACACHIRSHLAFVFARPCA